MITDEINRDALCGLQLIRYSYTYSRWWLAQSARAAPAASGGIPTGLHRIAR